MLAATLLLQAAAAPFAPPLDTLLLVGTERVERGLEGRRFTLERVVRFAREAEGFRGEVELRDVRSDAADPVPCTTEAGFAGLIGQTIVVHLSGDGRVTAVDGQAALWSRLCERVAGVAASRRALAPVAREALAERIAAPLGGPVLLKGSKATRAADGMIKATTQAEADVALAREGDAPLRSARVAFERMLRMDPATRSISRSRETTRTSVSGRETMRITTVEVVIAPPQASRTPPRYHHTRQQSRRFA